MSNKTYMEFANKGVIDLNAFKLLGASSKREATDKIGFFGSGLKYATALMLREGIEFKVYAGKKEIKFGLVKQDFSGIGFNVITVDGEKTSLTTEAGPDWEPWFAIREIYSNTIDEGGSMELVSSISPSAGETKIYVEMSEKLGDVTKNWQDYFSFKRPVVDETVLHGPLDAERRYKIFAKRLTSYPVIFRRGIRVGEIRHSESLFDYDFSDLEINESRVMKYTYKSQQLIGEALMFSESKEVISSFISNWKESKMIEYDETTWSYVMSDTFFGYGDKRPRFSDEWLNQLKEKRIVPYELGGFYGITAKTVGFPNKMVKMLKEQFGNQLNIAGSDTNVAYKITEEPGEEYKKIYDKLDKAGFTFPFENIKLGKFKDDDMLGQFDSTENLIVLCDHSKNWSRRDKTVLLLEELLHKKSGYSDNTREFQTFIISELSDKILESE